MIQQRAHAFSHADVSLLGIDFAGTNIDAIANNNNGPLQPQSGAVICQRDQDCEFHESRRRKGVYNMFEFLD